MARILWISDAGVPTGFGRVTHEIGERLVEAGHEVHVLSIMYEAKNPIETGMKLYRASAGPTGHFLGYDRTVELVERLHPDVVVTLEDIPQLRKRLIENRFDPDQKLLRSQPIISYVPVDGYNLPATFHQLRELVTVVPMTSFGSTALEIGNWIYHGVDSELFHPVDDAHPVMTTYGLLRSKAECREAIGIPQGPLVVGRVDTNTGRKDWGSTWRVMDKAYELGLDPESTLAVWHTKLNAPGHGVDLTALVTRGTGKYMVTNADDWPTGNVVALINCFDITLSTSRGEGFGLGLAESLACGVPVLATNGSAMTEVVGPGGVLVDGKAYMTNPYGVDLVLADTTAMAGQLVMLSRNLERRQELGMAGREHVIANFQWERTAGAFHDLISMAQSAASQAEPEGAIAT